MRHLARDLASDETIATGGDHLGQSRLIIYAVSALSAKLLPIFERDVPIHRGRIEYDIANFGQRVVVKALYHIIISCVVYSYACGEELSFHLYEPEVWLRFPKRHGSNSDSRKRRYFDYTRRYTAVLIARRGIA